MPVVGESRKPSLAPGWHAVEAEDIQRLVWQNSTSVAWRHHQNLIQGLWPFIVQTLSRWPKDAD